MNTTVDKKPDNYIKRNFLGWPDSKCHDKPARLKSNKIEYIYHSRYKHLEELKS